MGDLVDREDLTNEELKMIPSDNVTNFLTSIAVYESNNWNVEQLFTGTKYKYDDFSDSSKWLNPIDSEIITKNFFKFSPVFLSHKYSYKHSSKLVNVSPLVKTIIKYTPYKILVNNIYKTVDKLENSFYYTLEKTDQNKFSFKISPKAYKKRFLLGHETHSSKGYLDAIFKLKKIKLYNKKTLCYSSDLERIIDFFYSDHGFSIQNGRIYLNGELFAIKKSALLIPSIMTLKNWTHNEEVYVIVKDYYYKDEEIFKVGDVYNSPFCYYSWETQGYSIFLQKIYDFFSSVRSRSIKELDSQIEMNNNKAKSLMQLSAKLEHDKKERTMFLAKIVHEIKSPLSNMVMLIESIGEHIDCAPEYVKDGFSQLSSRSENLTRFVDNVMSFFNLDNESFKLKFETIDLSFLMNDILDSFTYIPNDKKLIIQSTIMPDRYIVTGDYYRLTQVFINIISNSVKFTERGRIDIKAGYENDFVFVSITDTGIGIDQDKIKTIFNKFNTYDDITNKNGIGLGLYITKILVDHHNGFIEVDSKPGGGSKFTVYLPMGKA